MLSNSLLTKILGQGALLVLVTATTATGCGGCNEPTLQCNENGEDCLICDGYGCYPAQPGAGGAGQGGAGQGGEGGGDVACDDAVTTCPCTEDEACAEGTRCIEGLCIAGCDFSYECGPGRVCADGQCGVGCDAATPCAEPGTVCDRGVCVPDAENPACSDAEPCVGAGEICVDGLCTTGCTDNADCAEGEICNAAAGACIADPSAQPGCDATTCTAQGQQCMADGFCHYPCSTLQSCLAVDNRFVACDEGICKTRDEVRPECTVDVPCPSGEVCVSNRCR